MGPSKGTIKREYSHLTENWEVPQDDIRLMRRLKRRSIASEMMEHNYTANAKRKNVGSCRDEVVKNAENSGHVLVEEVDKDYEFFLDKAVFHVDVVSDNNNIASDIDVNTSHDSDNDDETDAQYKTFLGNLREYDNSYILKVFVDNQLFCVKYEGQEERLHDLVNSEIPCEGDDEDYQLFLNSSRVEGNNLVYMSECAMTIKYGGSESEGKSSKVRQNLQVPFEATKLPNSRQASDDYRVAKKRHSEVLSDVVDEDWQIYLDSEVRKNSEEKRSAVWKNLQVFSEATEPPKARQVSEVHHVDKLNDEVHCGIGDEDYQLFLNSSRLDGDRLIFMPERAITIKYGRSESEGKSSKIRQNLQVPFEVTELPNSTQASNDYRVAKNKHHNEVLSDVVDEDWQIYLNSEVRKNSEEKRSAVWQNLQVFNEATEPPNAGQASDDYRVAKNNCHNEVWSDVVDEDWQIYLNSEVRKNAEEKRSAVRQILQVSNEATELPNEKQDLDASHVSKHKCNSKELCNIADENYQLFLKSVSTDGDNLIYTPENGVTLVYGEECDQTSTDSEPIILDPSQHYEDSQSIHSKSYYSSVSVFFLVSDNCNIHNM